MSIKLQNILLKLANDVLDLEKSGKTLGEPIDEAIQAILDLLDKSLPPLLNEDGSSGKWVNGWNDGLEAVRKVIKEGS